MHSAPDTLGNENTAERNRIRGFRREQGLLVSPSIAEEACTVDALLASKHPWVLRQVGSGSQPFFQEMLAHHGASGDDLIVIGRANSEHQMAAAIAMGAADVAPEARSAATETGLAPTRALYRHRYPARCQLPERAR